MKRQIFKISSVTILTFLFFFQLANAQTSDISTIIKQLKEKLGTPESSFYISSSANCEGPEGTYISNAESDGSSLHFKQIFSYREGVVDLKIEGKSGTDENNGESLSDFMIFYGKMHDYVRIALQPEYFLVQIDSLQRGNQESTLFGKTVFGYTAEYRINSKYVPSKFKLYLNNGHFITTIFETWSTTKDGILVPKLVRIIDGDKTFTFNYETVKVTPN